MEHKFIGKTYANKGTEVAFCHPCGFIHQTVLPSSDSAESYYGEKDAFYQTFSPPNWFVREKMEHDKGLWNPYYDYKLRLLKWDDGWPTFVFDVGCGAGWFVRRANQHSNATAWGYEPSSSARRFLDLPYISGERKLPDIDNIKIDIHMSLVLEHILAPRDELAFWVNQMKPSARIIVVVPSDFNPLQKRLKTLHFISPVHLNYFSGETLHNLMQSVGLRVIHQSATFPMELWQLAGLKHIGNDTLGHKYHMMRLYFEKTFGVRAFDLYYKLYQHWGIGRELLMVGERV